MLSEFRPDQCWKISQLKCCGFHWMFLWNRTVEKVNDPLFSRKEREDYPMCDTRYLPVQRESLVPTGPLSLVAANMLPLLAFVIFVFAHIISVSLGNTKRWCMSFNSSAFWTLLTRQKNLIGKLKVLDDCKLKILQGFISSHQTVGFIQTYLKKTKQLPGLWLPD